MHALLPQGRLGTRSSLDTGNRDLLRQIEQQIESTDEFAQNEDFYASLDEDFHRLHARIRAQHAANLLGSITPGVAVPTEWVHEFHRLRDEHPRILGQLDWLIRHAPAMVDQSVEDREVFLLRTRELIAVLHRHEAEEDRLFALALWHDTGGES